MSTLTTNYQFNKPTVGADSGVWGNDYSTGDPLVDPSPGLNGNWEKIDQVLHAMQEQIDEALQAAEDRKIPIGGLYTSASDDDPTTTLGYGTWVPWGEGRAMVGVGDNGERGWTPGLEVGAETHQLTADEVPAHTHGAGTLVADEAGAHDHAQRPAAGSAWFQQFSGGGNWPNERDGNAQGGSRTSEDGAHTHALSGDTAQAGGDQPHNNVQPSKAAYIWERTA